MTVQTQQQASLAEYIPSGFESAVVSPAGLGLLTCALIIVLAKYFEGKGSKTKLATARWGGGREKTNARTIACEQLRSRQHNRVALYIGTPADTRTQLVNGEIVSEIPSDPKTIYIPDAQRGVMVIGGPGSGKSFSMLNPLIRSAIDQGLPVILYDFKYSKQESATASAKGQAPILAGYALERGYDVTVLAPGYKESCIANPLDFLRDQEDSEMARQLAITINRNLKLGDTDNGNSFFTNAGDQLVQAILTLSCHSGKLKIERNF
ncbi:hypothetical protein LC593_35385 [Nostoc sp. CHAB 5844]|nr:hypothetical protein [Nostoc sp. CHAB 5844]